MQVPWKKQGSKKSGAPTPRGGKAVRSSRAGACADTKPGRWPTGTMNVTPVVGRGVTGRLPGSAGPGGGTPRGPGGVRVGGVDGEAQAQNTKLVLGRSGWTGFAPLTLADKAGLFSKHGLDVEIKMIAQKDRHLALAAKSIQCAATTVETHVAWNANGVPIVQIFQTDKSYGADGLAVRGDIKGFADL